MIRLRRRQALLGLGMALAGCTPEQKVVTRSNAAAVSNQNVRRPDLTEGQNASLLQTAELKRAFEAKWPSLGIAVEIVDADGAPDNGGPLITAANARFQASQLLFLQTGSGNSRDAFIRNYEIDARLYAEAPRRLIWRASTGLQDFWRTSHTASARPVAADRYVDSLTEKLRGDGLI